MNTLYAPHIGGGAEITLKILVETMAARGHEVCVVTTGPGRSTHVDTVDGVRVVRIGIHNLYWHFERAGTPKWKRLAWHLLDIYNLRMAQAVLGVVNEFKPDVVSCHNLAGFSAAVWLALRRAEVPVLQVLHDYYSLCPKSTMYSAGRPCHQPCLSCRVMRMPHARLSANVSAVVGISRYVLNRHLNASRFAGVGIKAVIPNARRGASSGRHVKAPEGKLRFGYIGTLAPSKGIELLLDACAKLPSTVYSLQVAGRGEPAYEQHLQDRASRTTVFLGTVEPADFFPSIDVLVVPSLWHEPLGMVVIEAFTYGVPVLASRVGGIPEMIEDGRNGWLFDPECPAELLACMQLLLGQRDQLRSYGEHALSSASAYTDLDAWAGRYESVLEQVLAEPSLPAL